MLSYNRSRVIQVAAIQCDHCHLLLIFCLCFCFSFLSINPIKLSVKYGVDHEVGQASESHYESNKDSNYQVSPFINAGVAYRGEEPETKGSRLLEEDRSPTTYQFCLNHQVYLILAQGKTNHGIVKSQ